MRISSSILAAGAFIGTMVGAGIFGIPYVVSRSGILASGFYFFILFFVALFLHWFFGETVLRTKEKHRLVGYAEKYLGRRAKILASFSLFFGVVGSLTAYLILAGHFLVVIFPATLSFFYFSIIAWAALSLVVFLGIKSIAKTEVLMNMGLFLAFGIIFFFVLPKVDPANFLLFNENFAFLPFGIFLFSLVAWNAVPEMEGILKNKKELKKIIFWSLFGVTIFYFLFGLILSGPTGAKTSQQLFEGLLPILGRKIVVLGGVFGLLSISTSFLVLANYLKNSLVLDFKVPRSFAFFLACFTPLFLFALGIRQFLPVVSFVGSFVGLIDGTLIVLTYRKAKMFGDRIPEYSLKTRGPLVGAIIAVLVFGALSRFF